MTARDGDQEGIPVVLMEAMAMKIPVVSTVHTGIPELVEDGKAGYLVPEKDVEDLVKKIGHLMRDQKLRDQMGDRGRAIIHRDFNIKALNRNLVQIFQECMQES